MSGWTTITLELRGEDDYYTDEDDFVTDDVEEIVQNNWRPNETGVLRPSSHTEDGDPVSFYAAQLPGHTDKHSTERRLECVSTQATRAVVVRANDTSDTGDAQLYVREGDEWVQTDTFEETQDEHGTPVGELAAATMYARHGIPAVSLFNRMHAWSLDEKSRRKTI